MPNDKPKMPKIPEAFLYFEKFIDSGRVMTYPTDRQFSDVRDYVYALRSVLEKCGK